MTIPYTDEEKREILEAIEAGQRAGMSLKEAHHHAQEEFKAAGKRFPSPWAIYSWKKQGKQEPAPEAEETVPEEAAPEAEETVPDQAPAGDYVKRLEAVVRMYRTHSERARDAVCDLLLPELEYDSEEES